MQQSCGAIRPIIPELIECGVDVLAPSQGFQIAVPVENVEALYRIAL